MRSPPVRILAPSCRPMSQIQHQPFRILEDSLFSGALNFAKMERRGVDTEVAYRKKFSWGTASLRGTWTHVIRNRDFLNPTDPNFANSYMRELADPQDEVNANLSLKGKGFVLDGSECAGLLGESCTCAASGTWECS